MTGLRLGVIAFLDVLGFKGIWSRENTRLVLDTMRRIKRRGRDLQGFDHGGSIVSDDGFDHRVKCISDTVIVVVAPRGRGCTDRMMYKAMFSATWIAASIMAEALDGDIPLLFRGCLGAGLMKMEGDFLIGPAIDETASLYEEADGPFLWMSPSALAVNDEYADTFSERIEPTLMIRYAVPLKRGKRIETLVHSYFGVRRHAEYRYKIRAQIDKAFGPKPLPQQLHAKYSNTKAFLGRVETLAGADSERVRLKVRTPYWDDLTFSQRLQILKVGGMDAADKFPRRSKKDGPR
jgi:hypothetical protein